MERYRSGHNGADSKSVCAKAHEGSNPSLSENKKASLRVLFYFPLLGFERVGVECPAGGRADPTLTEPAGETESISKAKKAARFFGWAAV